MRRREIARARGDADAGASSGRREQRQGVNPRNRTFRMMPPANQPASQPERWTWTWIVLGTNVSVSGALEARRWWFNAPVLRLSAACERKYPYACACRVRPGVYPPCTRLIYNARGVKWSAATRRWSVDCAEHYHLPFFPLAAADLQR